LIDKLLVDVDCPVGGHPRVPAVWLLEDVFLSGFGHSDIVIFSPLVLIPILYERVVMTRLSVSIMNAHCMQMIWVLIHASVSFLNLLLKSVELSLHVLCLVSDLLSISFKHWYYSWDLDLIFILHGDLVERRV
jgi:hypothetical protein